MFKMQNLSIFLCYISSESCEKMWKSGDKILGGRNLDFLKEFLCVQNISEKKLKVNLVEIDF